MNTPSRPRIGFELNTKVIPISAIVPLKTLRPTTKVTQKYQQIAVSVREVGLIEYPVVTPNAKERNSYFLLDGLLRLEAIKDLGWEEVECLIATDDEAYTYNKRINRLASVQEHRMIVRVMECGVSPEKIAHALNLDTSSILRRFRLLDGVCQEVTDQLADKACPMLVFELLKKMKPMRQIEAVELMMGQRNYSTPFIKAILAATPEEQLVKNRRGKRDADVSREQIARLERELEAVQSRTRFTEESYGEDNLQLTIAKSYLAKMLRHEEIVTWLDSRHASFLEEFREIVAMDSLTAAVGSTQH